MLGVCALLALRRRAWRLALVAMLVVSGCAASRVGTTDGGATDGPCTPALGAMLIEHACLHAGRGPLREVEAAASADGLSSAHAVNRTHTAYSVLVPGDETRERTGYVEYRPSRDGDHAIFSGDLEALSIEGPAGEAVGVSHDEAIRSCSSFDASRVVTLRRGERYRLRLSVAASSPAATLFFEHLGTFGDAAWAGRSCSGTLP
jgi:hypothetical protein